MPGGPALPHKDAHRVAGFYFWIQCPSPCKHYRVTAVSHLGSPDVTDTPSQRCRSTQHTKPCSCPEATSSGLSLSCIRGTLQAKPAAVPTFVDLTRVGIELTSGPLRQLSTSSIGRVQLQRQQHQALPDVIDSSSQRCRSNQHTSPCICPAATTSSCACISFG